MAVHGAAGVSGFGPQPPSAARARPAMATVFPNAVFLVYGLPAQPERVASWL